MSASSDDVVARSRGASNLFSVTRDSPSCPRSLSATRPTARTTLSLEPAVTSSSASKFPFRQSTALSSITYWLPAREIELLIATAPLLRSQTSRDTEVERKVPGWRPISANVWLMRMSESRFRNGDWSNCDARPCCRVPSKIGSPVHPIPQWLKGEYQILRGRSTNWRQII